MKHICTACGHVDYEKGPLARDGFTIDTRFGIAFGDISSRPPLLSVALFHRLAVSSVGIMPGTLALSVGRPDDDDRNISKRLSDLKMHMKRDGIPWPIDRCGDGYLWVGLNASPMRRGNQGQIVTSR